MTREDAVANLRSILAGLYLDEASARRVVADAGLNQQGISFDRTASNIWFSILHEAENTGKIEALFRVVLRDYEANPTLRNQVEAYRHLVNEGNVDSYGTQLLQFAKTSDLIDDEFLIDVFGLIAEYMHKAGFKYFEFIVPDIVNGNPGLRTGYTFIEGSRTKSKRGYSTELFERHGDGLFPKTQAALSYHRIVTLWVVSQTMNLLNEAEDAVDQWSKYAPLPKYKVVMEIPAKTSVIMPVSQGQMQLAVVVLEADKYIGFTTSKRDELLKIKNCITAVWFNFQARESQKDDTREALRHLHKKLRYEKFPE
jgi:hypothetical protein